MCRSKGINAYRGSMEKRVGRERERVRKIVSNVCVYVVLCCAVIDTVYAYLK